MKLYYRGIQYQALNNPVTTIKSKTIARFMGKTYRLSQSNVATNIASNILKYRGVTYQRCNENLTTSTSDYSNSQSFVAKAT